MKKLIAVFSMAILLQACSLDTTGGAGFSASGEGSVLDNNVYGQTTTEVGFDSSLGGWELGDGKLF